MNGLYNNKKNSIFLQNHYSFIKLISMFLLYMSINLKDDFYTYVNYKWLKNTKLDDNKAKLTEFTILHDKNNKKIKKIILKNKLFKHIYKLGLSKKSFDVIFPLIDFIKSNDLETILAHLTNIGIDHLFFQTKMSVLKFNCLTARECSIFFC